MIGAKKLTRKTWVQVSRSVSTVPSRPPPLPFGEIAALLTSACSSPPSSRFLISATARMVSSESARSTWMWSSGPASHGHSSGNACREQVITRHPAEEKRITVACPMPRLAPVRSRVRRGVLGWCGMSYSCSHRHSGSRLRRAPEGRLWVEPVLAPRLGRRVAGKLDAVVQAERAVVPELEADRLNAPAAPAGRTRHIADDVFGRDLGNRLLEGEAAFQRLRLLAR